MVIDTVAQDKLPQLAGNAGKATILPKHTSAASIKGNVETNAASSSGATNVSTNSNSYVSKDPEATAAMTNEAGGSNLRLTKKQKKQKQNQKANAKNSKEIDDGGSQERGNSNPPTPNG